MTFVQYLKDKCYFFALYALLMLFVSLIMLVSMNRQHALDNLLYTQIGCFFAAALYVVIGYYYRRGFYNVLSELSESGQEDVLSAVPKPQNGEQALYVGIMQKLQNGHVKQQQKLAREIRDHQDFIMTWIHEVKLPIAASRLVMENHMGKSAYELIDKLEDELSKIDNYVEQALYYSRIDSFSKDYFISEVQLSRIMKESVKKYAKLFITKRIRVHLEEEAPIVQSDSKWLSFILDQLVANALKYTGEDGNIFFHFEEDTSEKRLLVRDTGVGIKAEDISRVFDRGFTGSIGRSYAKSTGMGLYLAKQMALKLGHDLSIQSEEGTGTTVTIHYPKIRNYRNF